MIRWPLIRHIRWLVAVYEQNVRCAHWEALTGGIPHEEQRETSRIDAIWRGEA